MTSTLWKTTSAVQCLSSSRQLGRHTVPITNTDRDCRSDGRPMTSKRKSEESLERVSKRRATSPRPSEDCSLTFSGTTSSGSSSGISSGSSSGSSASSYTGSSDSSGETPSLSHGPLLVTGETKTSSKRKSTSAESNEGPRKRSRKNQGPSEDHVIVIRGSSSSTEDAGTSSSDKPGTSSSVISRAAFEAKYQQGELLGEGSYGSVFAGHRRDDNLPVAIKHISPLSVRRTSTLLEGKVSAIPVEVVLLLRLKPAEAARTSAVVTLLDWYDLEDDLILVLERPVPCMDLVDFINCRPRVCLPEHEAKNITKQLVEALIEVHARGVFHKDIKLENILMETGSDVPRVRLIDFGCGTFLLEGEYMTPQGTFDYFSPEWILRRRYRADPTTVWQVGVVLFVLLHGSFPFSSRHQICFEDPDLSDSLSFDCQDFVLSCLLKRPEARPTLENLQRHPWLV